MEVEMVEVNYLYERNVGNNLTEIHLFICLCYVLSNNYLIV